jgi:hypothetical protein
MGGPLVAIFARQRALWIQSGAEAQHMEPCQMKLAEIDLDDLKQALRTERTAWIKVADEEHRRPTDAERVTVCILMALEHALAGIPRSVAEMVGEDNRAVSRSSSEGDANSTPSNKSDANATSSSEDDANLTSSSEGNANSTS